MASCIPETYALLILAIAHVSSPIDYLLMIPLDGRWWLTLVQVLAEIPQAGVCEEEEVQFAQKFLLEGWLVWIVPDISLHIVPNRLFSFYVSAGRGVLKSLGLL